MPWDARSDTALKYRTVTRHQLTRQRLRPSSNDDNLLAHDDKEALEVFEGARPT